MAPHSNLYLLENKLTTVLKIYDVIGGLIDDVIFENLPNNDKL